MKQIASIIQSATRRYAIVTRILLSFVSHAILDRRPFTFSQRALAASGRRVR